MRIFYLVLFTCWCGMTLYAQQPYTKAYNTAQGLPSDETHALFFDAQEQQWVGTDRGVSQRVGNQYVNYTINDGLPENFVNHFFLSQDAYTWVLCGTRGRALAYFADKKFHGFEYNYVLEECLDADNRILSASIVNHNEVYISTVYQGVVKIKDGAWIPLGVADSTSAYNKIVPDPKLGLLSGICEVEQEKKYVKLEYNEVLYPNRFLNFMELYRLNEDTFFFTINEHLFVHTKEKDSLLASLDAPILALYGDDQKRLWVSANSTGVQVYSMQNLSLAPQIFFSDYRITDVTQDYQSNIWLSTHNNGVLVLPSLDILQYPTLKPSEDKSELFSFVNTDDEGRLYVLSSQEQVYAWNDSLWQRLEYYSDRQIEDYLAPERTSITHTKSPKSFEEKHNTLYAQCNTHLRIYNLNDQSFSISNGGCFDSIDTQEEVIRYTRQGIRQINKKNKGNKYSYNERLNCSMKLSDSIVWMGTQYGLSKHELNKEVKRIFADSITDRVTQMFKLDPHQYLITTITKGLYLANEDSILAHIQLPVEHNTNIINKVLIQKDTLYIATQGGVLYGTLAQLQNQSFTKIIHSDLLPCNNIKDLSYHEGSLFINSSYFLYKIKLGNDPAFYFPKLAFENLYVNNELRSFNEKNDLRYNQNKLNFQFRLQDYRYPDDLRLHYALINSEDTIWNVTDKSSLEFTNLSYEKYTLLAYAQNKLGHTSATIRYAFHIQKPFWRNPYYLTLGGILFLLLTYWTYLYQLNKIKRKNRDRELLLTYEQQALASQINPHFIFNIINNIQGYILSEEKMQAYQYLSKFARLMRMSLDHSRLKWVGLEEELKLIQIYLELESKRNENFSFRLQIADDVPIESLKIPSMILQPFLENSLKHGLFHLKDKVGELLIDMRWEGKNLLSTIEDNGIGREASAQMNRHDKEHISSGMLITQKRLQLLCSEKKCTYLFEIIDKEDSAGTIIRLYLPFEKQ